jgi:PleD family two-component response regulator
MISDSLPDRIRVLLVSSTGLLRQELVACFDEDFEIVAVADARAAEQAAAQLEPHALACVADDLFNCRAEDLVHRVRLASRSRFRVAAMLLHAHGETVDLPATYHAGADDIARWPMEADMLRARVRSMVRVATLEASMGRAAESGTADLAQLQYALSQAIHLINNAVAGISGRAQLAALTNAMDDAGLVPVCLAESRKMSLILAALHELSESITSDRDPAASTTERMLAALTER